MQLREIPITSATDNELDEEADWIYKHAFIKASVSTQTPKSASNNASDEWGGGGGGNESERRPPSCIEQIKKALDFMRNQQLEVPFIAFYRKEYVRELNINDLWRVYKFDAKWCQLLTRKKSLLQLFEKMRNYQLEKLMGNPDNAIPDDMRLIKDDDIDRLQSVETQEELRDVHTHFLLHYAHEIPAMQQVWRLKEKEKRRQMRIEARRKQLESLEDGSEPPEEIPDEDDNDDHVEESLKMARDSGPYSMCRKGGILGFAKRFGLTPEQFAENLRDNYQKHDVEQEAIEPTEIAKEYINTRFQTVEDVLQAAKFVVARQIAREPILRKSVREIFFERAKISVRPTKQGIKEIDEHHPIFTMKYLKNKPVRDFEGDQFLKLAMAEDDKLITITISETIEGNTSSSYLEEVKQFYQRDEFSKNVQEWNALRAQCVEVALVKMVLPDIRKELRAILVAEAKECVMQACCERLRNWIKWAPYTVNNVDDFDDDEWETKQGIRVLSIAYDNDPSQATFCALINPDGEINEYLRLSKITKRPELKAADLVVLTDFIRAKKPHVIAIGGESFQAMRMRDDLNKIVKTLMDEDQFPQIGVEIVNNDLAILYANSKKGNSDFREYPAILRQAVSIGRRLQDPLIEYSQLCSADEEILCLRYHTLQDQLSKEELLDELYLEFMNRTNEVGVDINLAVQNSLTVNLLQFICGLGPRKGQALLKILKQTNQRLENRTQLVTACHMGPKVFINCSGFIKIDTNSLGDSTEAYVEVLDGSRVHPETYEWARKMAVDALEYDDDEANPAGALEEILESPERLKDLDLDAFAVELERQGFGKKSITLCDIRKELNCRYKDMRPPFRSPSPAELFQIVTKETPETFYVGKMLLTTVKHFQRRKPQGDQLDNADPEENAETGLWKCPFCLKDDFPELSEVWNHFDAGACPGKICGIRVALDNGLMGYIHLKNLSDRHVNHPEERVEIGQAIHCRVIKIEMERFNVECSSKSSDLLDRNGEWRPKKDHYYDQEQEEKDTRKEVDAKKQTKRMQYMKRNIVHPAFHNISFDAAIKMMENMDQGEAIFRPSSKGADHLTVTWKVDKGFYQHIDVREEGKENNFSLGTSLWIGNEEFEDLDEIIARHVAPMAENARDLIAFKYYRPQCGGKREKAAELLNEEKLKNPNTIHYIVSPSKLGGQFMLSYLPRQKVCHEIVTVTPEGFHYRQQIFDKLKNLWIWFKTHFSDPIPTATPHIITPRSITSSSRVSFPTPALSQSSITSADAINKVAKNMPSHMLHSLSQVASKTPNYPYTPGYGGQSSYVNTPYTPSGQTPFMTPYHTTSQTPRYGHGQSNGQSHGQSHGQAYHQGQGHGQATPNNAYSNGSGQFAQPRQPPVSRQRSHLSSHQSSARPSYRSSPHVPSPRQSRHSASTSSNNRSSSSNQKTIEDEEADWEQAAESWESSKQATPKQ